MQKLRNKPKISDLGNKTAAIVFDLIGVSPEHDEHLRVLDEHRDANLVLVHYLTPLPEVSHVRGVIIDTKEAAVVAGSFPHTEEYSPSSEKAAQIQVDKDTCVTVAYEGTILRMFRASTGEWFLATHKRIDGRQSRWSGPAFGESWNKLWGDPRRYDAYLRSDLCYAFLLSEPANRLVCTMSEPQLYHVATFQGDDQYPPAASDYIQPHPNVILSLPLDISTNEEMLARAKALDWKVHAGLLVANAQGMFKLVPDQYAQMRNVRGNEPNLRMRYLQLLAEGRERELRDLFTEREMFFQSVDDQLRRLTDYLRALYETRYVRREFLRLPREEYYVLERVHRGDEDIEAVLRTSTPRQLNAMLKHLERYQDAEGTGYEV